MERKHWISIFLASLVTLCLLVGVFQLGVIVGYRKAMFSYRWAETYHQNFGGPRQGFIPNAHTEAFFGGHGTGGSILRIDGNEISLRGDDGIERVVVLTDRTYIRRGPQPAKKEDLQLNEKIVVIGRPTDQGKMEATFIRLF
jgi:hypothetical protein